MPFDWQDHDAKPLEERFDRETLGFESWYNLLVALPPFDVPEIDRETTELHAHLLLIFSSFLKGIDSRAPPTDAGKMRLGRPIVFVSHQRADVDEAERIADLACEQGLDYWLDIHDPVLKFANKNISPKDPRYSIIIAAIIEMALLNSTHLIAVHSVNSMASKWVPYELGRVRERRIQSDNTGGWFHPAIYPNQCGDYVNLCRIARGGEHLVKSWLVGWAGGQFTPLKWPAKHANRQRANQRTQTKPLPIK